MCQLKWLPAWQHEAVNITRDIWEAGYAHGSDNQHASAREVIAAVSWT